MLPQRLFSHYGCHLEPFSLLIPTYATLPESIGESLLTRLLRTRLCLCRALYSASHVATCRPAHVYDAMCVPPCCRALPRSPVGVEVSSRWASSMDCPNVLSPCLFNGLHVPPRQHVRTRFAMLFLLLFVMDYDSIHRRYLFMDCGTRHAEDSALLYDGHVSHPYIYFRRCLLVIYGIRHRGSPWDANGSHLRTQTGRG